MTNRNYSACLDHILKYEGGYVDHPSDPGGATNMGITIGTLSSWLGRPASKQEVKDLTRRQVEAIYRNNYWNVVKGDRLADGFDLVVFDAGVNSGPSRGVKWFQKALGGGVDVDGIMGSQTMNEADAKADGVAVIQKACANRLSFLKGLTNWRVFGRGWGRRVASVEAQAVAMYSGSVVKMITEQDKIRKASRKQRASATSTAVAGTGSGLAQTVSEIPDLMSYGAVGICALIFLVLVLMSRRSSQREDAYDTVIEEMKNG